MNGELPDVQAGFRKCRGTRDKIANISWIIEKATESQKKTFTSASLTMLKPLTLWITKKKKKGKKIIKEIGLPDHLACLLKNLYTGQEATVITRHGTMD